MGTRVTYYIDLSQAFHDDDDTPGERNVVVRAPGDADTISGCRPEVEIASANDTLKIDFDNLDNLDGSEEIQVSRSSSSAHINMVPDELLIMIFIRLRNVNTEDNAGFKCWLFALMHTCQRWRKVASESSQCWTQLDYFGSEEIVKMFLERSNKAELTVKLDRRPGRDEDDVEPNKCFGFALEQENGGNRIKDLSVVDYPENETTWKPVVDLIGKSAPALKKIHLASPYIMFFSPAEPKLVLPPLTPEALPSLRYVYLSDMCLRWNESKFRNLTSLRLKSLRSRYQPSLSQILDISEESPLMEHLDLDNTAPSVSTDHTVTRSKSVIMSNLKTLYFHNMNYALCLEFMNHLKFECQLKWSVSCTDYQIDQASTPLNKSLVANTTQAEITRISISSGYVFISGFNKNRMEVSHISFNFLRNSDKPKVVFAKAVDYIRDSPWSQAENMKINSEVDDPKDEDNIATWISLLEKIPNVTVLGVDFFSENCDEFPNAFAKALEGIDKPNDSDETRFLLPRLTDLSLRHVDFSEDSSSFEVFMNCLKKRNEHGLRLKRLVLVSAFGYSQERVKELSELVDDLVWEEAYMKFMGQACKSRKEYKLRKEEHSRANPNPLVIDVTPFHGR